VTSTNSAPTAVPDFSGNITEMLAHRVMREPEAVFLRTLHGDLTFSEVQHRAALLAGSLQRLGIEPGTSVALLMRNSLEQVLVWFALARLGAVHAPMNTALVGVQLEHALRVSESRFVVVDSALRPALDAVIDRIGAVNTVIEFGAPNAGVEGATRRAYELFDLASLWDTGAAAPIHAGDDLDAATMLFTSGTTGVSKACVLSHRYLARQGQLHARQFGLRADDVLYCPFPLFHIDAATLTVVAALAVGATAALGERFSASRFWDEVRTFDASVFNFMGATLTILWKREPADTDRHHRVRLAWGVPMPDWKAGWEQRFGIPLYEIYGLTDGGICVYDPLDGTQRPGACGKVIDEYEIRIAETDGGHARLEPPAIGEILVRGREPGLTMTEYYGMPEATARTIDVEGWVHTGDLGSLDEDGYLTFHGRMSDSIRRRGENIAAYEVEQIVEAHPGVREVAAIGVPSELTEEDVKVCVVLKPGARLTHQELHAFCRETAPAFMVPRYIEFVETLPKTPTQKVEKFRLKEVGVSEHTWDADQSARKATPARG
jgi:carnitine-CoA ligase